MQEERLQTEEYKIPHYSRTEEGSLKKTVNFNTSGKNRDLTKSIKCLVSGRGVTKTQTLSFLYHIK